MSDSKLTYLKPPAPSSCYRGCREGCECEQPAKEPRTYLAMRERVAEMKAAQQAHIEFGELPHLVRTISSAAAIQERWDIVMTRLRGENGKSGEPYTPWFRNLKQASALPVGGVGKAQEPPQ